MVHVTAQRVIAIVALLSLAITVSANYGDQIAKFISSQMNPSPDYSFGSYDKPRNLTLSRPLIVSDAYYYGVDVKAADSFLPTDAVKFSVVITDLGKRGVANPLLRIMIVDSLDQERGEWSGTPEKQTLTFAYEPPPADQIPQGSWKVIVLLYNGDTLVAYSTREFRLQSSQTSEVQQILTSLIAIAALMLPVAIIDSIRNLQRKRRHKA